MEFFMHRIWIVYQTGKLIKSQRIVHIQFSSSAINIIIIIIILIIVKFTYVFEI